MTLGGKLTKLRKEQGYTQEQLAEILGVSRQAISKWESDAAYPETEKLIRLGKLYGCSMDYLLLDREDKTDSGKTSLKIDLSSIGYERVSKQKIGNLPLWHINIGFRRVATGVFAVGLSARGIVSVGLASVGIVSAGIASVGLLSLGCLAVGLLAIGAISVGVIALGAAALGIFALGALAVGDFAVGALAIGEYAAYGDAARGGLAIGFSEANGAVSMLVGEVPRERLAEEAGRHLSERVPGYFRIFQWMFLGFLK